MVDNLHKIAESFIKSSKKTANFANAIAKAIQSSEHANNPQAAENSEIISDKVAEIKEQMERLKQSITG
jgi:hypothetical protein